MKKMIFCALIAMSATTVRAYQAPEMDNDTVKEASDTVAGFKFTDVKLVKTTPVKDQNKSGTCWCFAGTSFMEDEIMRKGGPELDLSEMYTVRHCYLDKADRFIRNYGDVNFAQGGGLHDIIYVWGKYGIVPEEAYTGLQYGEKKHDHYEMEAGMKGYLKGINTKPGKKLTTAWKRGFEGIVDAYLGEEPASFTYQGKSYTPQSFAASLPIDLNDYIAISSFTHHPFYQNFALEVPDNWMSSQYYNVPLDEMQAVVDNALDKGYPVMWAADVSEGGFKWKDGYAVLPKEIDTQDMDNTELSRWVKLSDKERADKRYEIDGPCAEMEVTQEVRQQMYDNQETTDDHGMEIVGKAVDQAGNPYYKVKNSWDTNQVYDGFFYVSIPYFRAKTMGVMVNKEALPKDTAKKVGK